MTEETFNEKVDFWGDVGKGLGFFVWAAIPIGMTIVSGFTPSLLPLIIIGIFAFPLTFMCLFSLAAIFILGTAETRRIEKKAAIDKTNHEERVKKAEVDGFVEMCRGKQ